MTHLDRRAFLETFLKGAGCYAVVASVPFVASCDPGEDAEPLGRYRFPQGLASGDPGPDSVVLWTRVERAPGGEGPGSAAAGVADAAGAANPGRGSTSDPVRLVLEVAADPDFGRLVAEREVEATAASDHTVRVIVQGLEPDTRYFYRFRAGSDVTPLTGRTRTAPAPDADRPVRIAFASCQSYEAGYYGAWRTLVNRDEAAPQGRKIDFVLHLGDFIYEALGYGAVRQVPPFPSGGAVMESDTEWASTYAVTVDDYRHLWKTYLSDPDLQAARARFPFVVTWDDHEFTNDAWQAASNYAGPSEPDQVRKVAANQAWFEYVPAHLTGWVGSAGVASRARDFEPTSVEDAPFQGPDDTGLDTEPNNRAAVGSLTIYRSQRWGRHVELVVTDLRSYRTEHALPGELSEALGLPFRYLAPVSLVHLLDRGRDVPGGAPATLDIGGTSLPNPRADQPTGTLLGPEQKAWWKEVTGQTDATWLVWANSVPLMPMRIDLDRVDPAQAPVVLSTDTWDGYPSERRELLEHLLAAGRRNVVSLSGDNHNTFAGRIFRDFEATGSDADPEPMGAEFSICGISSPSAFSTFAGAVAIDDPLRALVVHEGPDGPEAALNLTFTHGAGSSATLGRTRDLEAALAARNPAQNPHLAYVDADAYGFGIATVGAEATEVELVTVERPVEDRGPEGARVLRTARFRVPARKDGEAARLQGPEVEGTGPFPRV